MNDIDEYKRIERERQKRVGLLVHSLLEEREKINQRIEDDFKRIEAEEKERGVTNENLTESAVITKVSIIGQELTPDAASTNCLGEASPQINSSTLVFTNIPFSNTLIERFVNNEEYLNLEKMIEEEKNRVDVKEQVNIKARINKRLSQLSSDSLQVQRISNDLSKYKDSFIFMESFVIKILEQGKVQVSSRIESYKEYSSLFSSLLNDHLLSYFRVILFTKKGGSSALKGMYSVYFGLLKQRNMYDEAWFFIASVLNIHPGICSIYVIEVFLIILGEDLVNWNRNEFFKIVAYLRKTYLPMVDNDAAKVRISNLMSNYR
jgi:hypothetical protein